MAVTRGEMKRGNRFVLRRHKFKLLLLFIVVIISFLMLSNYSSKSSQSGTKLMSQGDCKPGQANCNNKAVQETQKDSSKKTVDLDKDQGDGEEDMYINYPTKQLEFGNYDNVRLGPNNDDNEGDGKDGDGGDDDDDDDDYDVKDVDFDSYDEDDDGGGGEEGNDVVNGNEAGLESEKEKGNEAGEEKDGENENAAGGGGQDNENALGDGKPGPGQAVGSQGEEEDGAGSNQGDKVKEDDANQQKEDVADVNRESEMKKEIAVDGNNGGKADDHQGGEPKQDNANMGSQNVPGQGNMEQEGGNEHRNEVEEVDSNHGGEINEDNAEDQNENSGLGANNQVAKAEEGHVGEIKNNEQNIDNGNIKGGEIKDTGLQVEENNQLGGGGEIHQENEPNLDHLQQVEDQQDGRGTPLTEDQQRRFEALARAKENRENNEKAVAINGESGQQSPPADVKTDPGKVDTGHTGSGGIDDAQKTHINEGGAGDQNIQDPSQIGLNRADNSPNAGETERGTVVQQSHLVIKNEGKTLEGEEHLSGDKNEEKVFVDEEHQSEDKIGDMNAGPQAKTEASNVNQGWTPLEKSQKTEGGEVNSKVFIAPQQHSGDNEQTQNLNAIHNDEPPHAGMNSAENVHVNLEQNNVNHGQVHPHELDQGSEGGVNVDTEVKNHDLPANSANLEQNAINNINGEVHRHELGQANEDGEMVDGEVKGQDLPVNAVKDISPQCMVAEAKLIDCHPEAGATQQSCETRGCCWRETTADFKSPQQTDEHDLTEGDTSRSNGPPSCYYSADFPSYVKDKTRQTPFGETAYLMRDDQSPYPNDVQLLQLDVFFETENRVHFKIYDPKVTRYEVPIEVPNVAQRSAEPNYSVEYTTRPFGISVIRKSTHTVLFNSTVGPLIFADQFLQITSTLASPYIYGLGEHRGHFLHDINWSKFAFWTRDHQPEEHANLYGSHPFYLSVEKDGKAHGVFLLNSNAMDVILQPAPYLTWRTIGGVLDFYVFLGPTPDEVIQQYTEVIGRPFMPPYWGLGFHLCRWGYDTLAGTRAVTERMRQAKIPQDVQWNDNDYSIDLKGFTLNTTTFGGIKEFIEDLHANGQHYIHIVDPGISNAETPGTYEPYDLGKKMDVFIKMNGLELVGQVWTNQTVFPDFTAPQTQEWWTSLFTQWHQRVPFDGLWIDMNEPVNFLNGSWTGCPDNNYENPPYTPDVVGGKLNAETICASASQHTSFHYNVHSLYGLSEMNATHRTITSITPEKRPFIISRSTYPSSGRYGGHWLGDNHSLWKDLYYSIPGILTFNLFGIPLVGADICGFHFNASEPLCQRWHQLGAFYPFSRNHNSLNYEGTDYKCKDQDPTAFSPEMQDSTRKALLLRYSLLPYLYTLFHKSHVNGSTVARPLFFEFPNDPQALAVDRQFLWGPALLITPVLEEGKVELTGYFTNHSWYDYFTGERLPETGKHINLPTPMDKINLHIQGGYVIPGQFPSTTTVASRQNKFTLTIALCAKGLADGDLYWDDGESMGTFERGDYLYVEFNANTNSLVSRILHAAYNGNERDNLDLGFVRVFGVPVRPTTVTANGKEAKFEYTDHKVLQISDLQLSLLQPIDIQWR